MDITEDSIPLRRADERAISEKEALQLGMEENSKEFV